MRRVFTSDWIFEGMIPVWTTTPGVLGWRESVCGLDWIGLDWMGLDKSNDRWFRFLLNSHEEWKVLGVVIGSVVGIGIAVLQIAHVR